MFNPTAAYGFYIELHNHVNEEKGQKRDNNTVVLLVSVFVSLSY